MTAQNTDVSDPTVQTPADNSTPAGDGGAGDPPKVEGEGEPKSDEPKGDEPKGSSLGSKDEPKDPVVDDTPLELTIPEGAQFDEAMVDWFKTAAKEAGLDSEKASAILKGYNEHSQALLKSQADAAEKERNEWGEQVKRDPDFGGQKFAETTSYARKALREFGDADLPAEIDRLGIGNHPGLIKLLSRAGRLISEDGALSGSRGSGKEKTFEQKLDKLFPESAQKG